MKLIQIALSAVLLAFACASPSFAQLNVRDANGLVQRTCEVTDATGWYHPCNVMEAMNGGQPFQLSAETDHSLDVTIKASPGLTAAQLAAANLALHSDMLVLENLLTPLLQAGGFIGNPNFLSDALVVNGDQTFMVGTQQHATMDTNGRWKVGLSSARLLGTTASTYGDLVAGIDPSGNQQGLRLDGSDNLKTDDVNSAAALTAAQTMVTDLGPPGASACTTDTGSCSLNALLQRSNVLIDTYLYATLYAAKADLDTIATTGKTSYNRGGSITTGGTAQTLMAANAARKAWSIQNQSSANLYVSCIATATQDNNSLLITPGQLYESQPQAVDTGACSIIGPTSGQIFYAREF